MKNLTLTILAIVTSVLSFCQSSIELSFTAVYQEQNVPLDSILIENLTQPGEVMVYSDTLITLEVTTGINNNEGLLLNKNFFVWNFPNPVKSSTCVEVYLSEKETIDIQIIDVTGRQIISRTNTLEKGKHTFSFYPGNKKCYLLALSTDKHKQTLKIVNMADGNIEKLVYNGIENNIPNYKTYPFTKDFPYSIGDELRFTGYADNPIDIMGSDAIEDAPLGDDSYTFNITEGISCPGLPSVNYLDQEYNTVQIGEQCWLRENLDIGTMIQHTNNMQNNGTIEKYCYDNLPTNCDVYGGLYQWDEMMEYSTTPGVQGICPGGWHVPTINEYTEMITYLCDYPSEKLKEAGTVHWGCSNDLATNESGFTGLPGGGFADWSGSFLAITLQGDHWSSNDFGTTNGACRGLVCNGIYILEGSYDKHTAISVRCIKDN